MSFGLRDIDKGFRAFAKRTADLARSGRAVTVGVHADKAARSGKDGNDHATNVLIAAVHEFGSPEHGIPERSFVRATVAEHGKEYAEMCRDELADVIKGEQTVEKALDRVGLKVKADMIARINNGIPPELKEATIRRKGSSKPLIDTGALKQAIDEVVEK